MNETTRRGAMKTIASAGVAAGVIASGVSLLPAFEGDGSKHERSSPYVAKAPLTDTGFMFRGQKILIEGSLGPLATEKMKARFRLLCPSQRFIGREIAHLQQTTTLTTQQIADQVGVQKSTVEFIAQNPLD